MYSETNRDFLTVTQLKVFYFYNVDNGIKAGAGNRLDFHKQSSVWPNQSMIDCVIGSLDAILKISACGRWDEGLISTDAPLAI